MKEAHKFILAKVMEKDNNSSGVEVVLHSQIPAMRFYEKYVHAVSHIRYFYLRWS